jgi:hypothetical protein
MSNPVLVYPSLQSLPQSSGMANDPWSPHAQTQEQPPSELTFFDGNAQPEMNSAPNTKNDPWSILDSPAKNGQYQPNLVLAKPVQQSDEQPMQPQDETIGSQRPNLKTPECFLGQNSLLVNLDNLMGPSTKPVKTGILIFIIY